MVFNAAFNAHSELIFFFTYINQIKYEYMGFFHIILGILYQPDTLDQALIPLTQGVLDTT
jgi:hypothetical protein